MYKDFDAGFEGDFESSSDDSLTLQADGAAVDLPDASYIRDADIMRDGMDLILDGPQGEITIEGYFSADPAPTLTADDGTALSPELVNSFVKSAPEYAQNMSMTDESPVGAVNEVSGEASVTRTDGSVESAQIGMPIYQGDIVETNADGAVNITFSDDSSFAVSENARLAIDEYVFDPATDAGSQNFSVLKGVFVFTSGLIGRDDPDDVNIDTPMGSIGIRGTIIAGDVDAGEITVVEGAIVLRDFDGNEMTLASQFDTATFKPGEGIEHNGQKAANDVADKFQSVSKVAPALFSSINDAAAESVDEHGVNEGPDTEELLHEDAPEDLGGEPEVQANPDGSVDQNSDGEVDGSINDAADEGEAVGDGEGEAGLEGPRDGEPLQQEPDIQIGHDELGGDDSGLDHSPHNDGIMNADRLGENIREHTNRDTLDNNEHLDNADLDPITNINDGTIDPNATGGHNGPEIIHITDLGATTNIDLGYGDIFDGVYKAAIEGGEGQIYVGDATNNAFTNYNSTQTFAHQNISVHTGGNADSVVIAGEGDVLDVSSINTGAGDDQALFMINGGASSNAEIGRVDGEFGDDNFVFDIGNDATANINEVHGGSGHDTIKFEFGTDADLNIGTLLGNDGDDTFVFDVGANTSNTPAGLGNISGGSGNDTLAFVSSDPGLTTIDFKNVGNIDSIEKIDLDDGSGKSQALTLHISQVLQMAEYDAGHAGGRYVLRIDLDVNDVISIDTDGANYFNDLGPDIEYLGAGADPGGYDIYHYGGPDAPPGGLDILLTDTGGANLFETA